MPNLTNLSDINELYILFILCGGVWVSGEIENIFTTKCQIIGEHESLLQIERAKCMVTSFLLWASQSGYVLPIKQAWWTGRYGSLQAILPREIDYRKNPTDVLVQFTDGPSDGLLGISAKSTRGKNDIGFKNLGLGTVEEDLSIQLSPIVEQETKKVLDELGLPQNVEERKLFIRDNPQIRRITRARGSDILQLMRDMLFVRLQDFDEQYLKSYILDTWLNASPDKYPPYVKVTGLGSKVGDIRARVEHPLHNDKVKSLIDGPLIMEKYGFASIGISGAEKKVMKIRAKYSSEKLASSLKFMGDPW